MIQSNTHSEYLKIIEKQLSLKEPDQIYDESDFRAYREKNCRKMQRPFLQFCFVSLCILLFMRIFVLQYVNIIHSYGLPSCLVLLFWYFNEKN